MQHFPLGGCVCKLLSAVSEAPLGIVGDTSLEVGLLNVKPAHKGAVQQPQLYRHILPRASKNLAAAALILLFRWKIYAFVGGRAAFSAAAR